MMKLLIGYDGSECAGKTFRDLRRAGFPLRGVTAQVLSVADVWPVAPASEYVRRFPGETERVSRKVDAALAEATAFADEGEEAVSRLFPEWVVESDAVADSPYWGLVSRAQEWGADLLVVGSHGRSAIGAVLFGSVSQHVVLYARCSARVGRCRTEPVPDGAPVRLVLAWDGSPDARMAMEAVGRRTWPEGSECRIVTAMDTRLATDLRATLGSGAVLDERAHLEREADQAAEVVRLAGMKVPTPIIQMGDPKRVLLEEAEKWKADCIFVGARGMSRIERVLLGSVSSTVAARATCSVEVVRVKEGA